MNKKYVAIAVLAVGIVILMWYWSARKPAPVVLPEKDVVETVQYRYTSYSKEAFDGAAGKRKRVYFFSSPTCLACKTAHEEFLNNPNDLPQDVVVFITDINTEKETAAKYQIATPHAFVQVDEKDAAVAAWSGGGIKELKEKIR